jgi:hypothetical protein
MQAAPARRSEVCHGAADLAPPRSMVAPAHSRARTLRRPARRRAHAQTAAGRGSSVALHEAALASALPPMVRARVAPLRMVEPALSAAPTDARTVTLRGRA